MPEDWFTWVGRTIADDIPLLEYLGGSGDTAVFSTAIVDREGVVKLVVMDPAKMKERLAAFKLAEKLSHPHLLRVFRTGKCQVDEENLVYMVTEFAAENVAQVLPDRALTHEETRAMLTAVLASLQYLHAQGFVHADLKPSHIMATGNQLKISVDGVHRIGEALARTTLSPYDAPEAKAVLTPASDMWSLGVTLAKVLTQKVAESPKAAEKFDPPFREIVMRCLAPEPEQRPSLIDIYNILEGKAIAPQAAVSDEIELEPVADEADQLPVPQSRRTKRRKKCSNSFKIPLLSAAAVAVVVAGGFAISQYQSSVAAGQNEPSHTGTSPVSATNSKPPTVTRRFAPDVSPEMKGMIRGAVKIGVKVTVDPHGNVVGSELLSLGPSNYFDNLATEAARQWKFTPAPHPTAWDLEFNFTRKETTVVPTLIDR